MAGGEIITLASEHPDRISGLVYLDALGEPRDFPASDPPYMALFKALPPPNPPPPALSNRPPSPSLITGRGN